MKQKFLPHALPITIILVIGVLMRIALWDHLPRQGMISDEAEYLAAANWLAEGRGFSWHQGWFWTRAPIYPLFLAVHITLFGMDTTPIYITQIILSLITLLFAYAIAVLATKNDSSPTGNRTLATIGTVVAALCLPLTTNTQMLLSETLYLFLLLGACLMLAYWAHNFVGTHHAAPLVRIRRTDDTLHTTSLQDGVNKKNLILTTKITLPLLAGILFGIATLTRGLTLGFLPLVALWLWWVWKRKTVSALPMAPLIFLFACAITILPWSWYATRTYGGFVLVDTTGAYNLLLGVRMASDDGRASIETRQFALALLDEQRSPQERQELVAHSCLWQKQHPALLDALQQPVATITQSQRQQLMTAEARCLLQQEPQRFIVKGLQEMIAFFQINYTGAERMNNSFTLGRLPRWYTLMLFLLEDTLYAFTLPLAVVGWSRAQNHTIRPLFGLWFLFIVFTAPLLFAINRFRLPLLPFLCIYAAMAFHKIPPSTTPLAKRSKTAGYILASLLALVIFTPYAYLQKPPASWASYLGPYPSSLGATRIAWDTRPAGLRHQQLITALGSGDATEARRLLEAGGIDERIARIARPLLAGLEGDPAHGLTLLPDMPTIDATGDWQAAVVRGHLLRAMGDDSGAKAAFTPVYVDDENPVDWAWDWLSPVPTRRIDLAGNLDLGYIRGFYLGEGDPSANGTFRWSGPEALLRFPQQGRETPQQICLRADGRGVPNDLPLSHMQIALQTNNAWHNIATIPIQRDVQVYCESIPATPAGSDIIIRLQSDIFVPNAADLINQQGPQTGQLRLLGVRLDWVELRDEG